MTDCLVCWDWIWFSWWFPQGTISYCYSTAWLLTEHAQALLARSSHSVVYSLYIWGFFITTFQIILCVDMSLLYFWMYHLSRPSQGINIILITAHSLLPLFFPNLYLSNRITPHSHFCPDECTETTQDSSQWFTVVSAPWCFWLPTGRIRMKTEEQWCMSV